MICYGLSLNLLGRHCRCAIKPWDKVLNMFKDKATLSTRSVNFNVKTHPFLDFNQLQWINF